MNVTGSSKVIGLIGNPVAHSISPLIHNFLSERLGINAIYVPFKVEDIEAAVKGAAALGIVGLNITIPHKQSVMKHIASIDEAATRAGSVNTLKLDGNKYTGFNTDVFGIKMCVDSIDLNNSSVMIYGAGGAAYAAASAVAEKGVNKIFLYNRTKNNAYALAEHINKYYNCIVIVSDLSDYNESEKIKLCIQTTPLGMENYSGENELLRIDRHLGNVENIFDIIAKPSETPLLKKSKALGINCIGGFDMLIFQALRSYEIWFDITISENLKNEVFKEMEKYR